MRNKITFLITVIGLSLLLQLASPGVSAGPPPLRRPDLSGVVRFPRQVPQEVREGPPPEPALGADVNVSNNTAPQNETAAAVDPTNANHIVAAANDYRLGDSSCGLYNSTNGGGNWTAQMLPRLFVGATTNAYDAAGDPSVAFDGDGVASVGCLHFERGGNNENAIVVHTITFDANKNIAAVTSQKVIESPDGNSSGGGVFHDKPYVAVNPNGAVYVSWTRFVYAANGSLQSADIVFAYKTPTMTAFSVPVIVGDTPFNQGSVPVVGTGIVAVAWLRYDSPMQIVVDKAPIANDGSVGAFGTDKTIAAINPIPDAFTGQSFRVNSFPTLAAYGNNLYAAWAQRGAGSDEGDIAFSRSTDGGATWSVPIRVNNDIATKDQFFPWMAVDGSGNIHIVWYDKRDDKQDKKLHTYYAVSTDGGSSFPTNQRVSDRASNPSGTDQFGGKFIGDYNGIGADPSGVTAYPAFMAYRPTGPGGKFADQEVYGEKVTAPSD